MRGLPQEVHYSQGLASLPLRTSLHWWIARRLEANVNVVNTSNTQKIPLGTHDVCRQDNPGRSSSASANVLPAADPLSRLPPESSVVNRKMFPCGSSGDSLSAYYRLHIYEMRQIIIHGEKEESLWVDWVWQCILVTLLDAWMNNGL